MTPKQTRPAATGYRGDMSARVADCVGCFDTGECLSCWLDLVKDKPCKRCGGSGNCPDCGGKNRVIIENDKGESDES